MTLSHTSETDVVVPALPAAVLWDMDGTLVDTEPYWIQAEHELVAEQHLGHRGHGRAADADHPRQPLLRLGFLVGQTEQGGVRVDVGAARQDLVDEARDPGGRPPDQVPRLGVQVRERVLSCGLVHRGVTVHEITVY